MTHQASGTFKNTGWEENTYAGVDEQRKLTDVSATFAYSGDITGESVLKYLMSYNSDGSCDYFGLERVSGKIGDRAGSFTLHQQGRWTGTSLSCDLKIIDGSGDGDLTGITGQGRYTWDMNAEAGNFTIDYDIAEV